jgi:hypothetical protein
MTYWKTCPACGGSSKLPLSGGTATALGVRMTAAVKDCPCVQWNRNGLVPVEGVLIEDGKEAALERMAAYVDAANDAERLYGLAGLLAAAIGKEQA